MPLLTDTYVRFVCFETVERQRNRLGVFQALEIAEQSEVAEDWALKELAALDRWFTTHLARPEKFASGRARLHGGEYVVEGQTGLSWFKPGATEHIRRMHRLKAALEACGIHVDILTTRDPGRIIWQDDHQIVAEPGHRRF
ncbi:hypothetical protein [Brevundimonas sp.]|uniref:hypothetical protein n=1 Tax=Brevundimonas sp. TaxID=1871086 RepID=UPI001D42405F|nr:hypothetical protein [Brevundimonas sp.]MBL0946767.1 hypothetical protein [Brevundimonas sp.]